MIEAVMDQIEKIEDAIFRLTSEQYARLLAFAELLIEENSRQDASKIVMQTAVLTAAELLNLIQHNFSEPQRQRLRELTQKSEAEELSNDERAEYITLAEQRETADAEFIQAIATTKFLPNLNQ